MNNEKLRILSMLKEGKISADEASVLLDQLGEEQPSGAPAAFTPARANADRMLRVRVVATEPGNTKPTRVDVNLPLKIARLAGQLIRMMPQQANDAMLRHGVNVAEIDWEDVIDALAETGGDIVNIAHESDEEQVSVRIYVE